MSEQRYWKDALREAAPAFAKQVAPLYAVLDWRWHDKPEPPGASLILKSLLELIESTSDPKADEISHANLSGGLRVWWERGDDGDVSAGFSFELDHNVYDVRLDA